MGAMDQLLSLYKSNSLPGMSSLDDPNNPNNFTPQPVPRQPAQLPAQALAGSSENAAPQEDPGQAYYKAMLAQSAINPEMQKQIQSNIDAQQKGIGELQSYKDSLKGAPVQTDFSPLMALVDSLTGSSISKGYSKPQSGEDRIGALSKIQNMSQEQRNKITQDLILLAKGKNASGAMRGLAQQANLDFRERNSAQKNYDKEIGPVKQAFEASTRFNGLLDAANSGKLVPTAQLLNQLTEDQAKLVSGKSNYAEGSAQRLAIDNYAQRMEALKQKISGEPAGFLSKATAKQLKDESNVLVNEYMNQADSIRDQLSNGTPRQVQAVNERHEAVKKTYGKRFGGWSQKESASQYDQTATNPTSGEKIGLINGQWVPIGK